ncbi:hypothetical protein [Glaciecola sp. KUL10]|uniref:hypothetical protein n=1 Tax=Glaciecola sp. (strain KUL10) TaxID=2161813 RepID=UPI0011B7FE05|nr:hypothetical protein [Glaciecola sp. KUL10]
MKKWIIMHRSSADCAVPNNSKSIHLSELLAELVTDPKSIEFRDINDAGSLLEVLLEVTEQYYPMTFSCLRELKQSTSQKRISVRKLLLATHFVMGSKRVEDLNREISVYDLKKTSKVWFTQLLSTVARHECMRVIEEQCANRKPRKDKKGELRIEIQKELDLAKTHNKKANQAAIARKLKLSKQRVNKLVEELYGKK